MERRRARPDEYLAFRRQWARDRQPDDVHRFGRDGHGGSFGEYDNRVYGYDPNLQFLPPPWFPAIDDTYTTTFFREVKP